MIRSTLLGLRFEVAMSVVIVFMTLCYTSKTENNVPKYVLPLSARVGSGHFCHFVQQWLQVFRVISLAATIDYI